MHTLHTADRREVANNRAPDAVIPFEAVRPDDRARIGRRAARLARARREGLPVPAGVVIVADALGCRTTGDASIPIADPLDEVSESLGHHGQTALRVSLSAVNERSSADGVEAARSITSGCELLHAVRRFSVTATLLGDTVAAIVQHDVDPRASGTLMTQSGDHRHDHRLDDLARRVVDTFGGNRAVDWAIDAADQLWIIDIGPEQPR